MGVYVVNATEVSREFLRATEKQDRKIDAQRLAHPKPVEPLTLAVKAAWATSAREWAATYASVFRLELGASGRCKVVYPWKGTANGEAESRIVMGTWTLKRGRVRVETGAWGVGVKNWDQPLSWSGDGFNPSSWMVGLPDLRSNGPIVRIVTVNLALQKQ